MLLLNGLLFWQWLVVVTPHILTSHYEVQETVTLGLLFIQYILKTCMLCSFCSCLSSWWDHLAQTLWYCNVVTFVSDTLKSIFSSSHSSPGCNLLICVDWLSKVLFILWCDTCAWPSGTWLAFHITGTIDEIYNPLPHCANIHSLLSTNVQQALMNINGCYFFLTEEFSDTPVLHTLFHVRRLFVRWPLCYNLPHGNRM